MHHFILVMVALVGAFALYCLLDNPCKNSMRKYRLTEEMLEEELRQAEEVYPKQLFVSDNYIFHKTYERMRLFKVDDIVWMHKEYIRDHRYFYRKEYYIVIYTCDRKKSLMFCPYICHDESEIDMILEYFQKRFPHILVGYSKEAKRMFKKEYDRFLQVKYIYGIKERKYERKSEE
ncbi:MAG: hypothetical protein J6B19_03095 [Lachnospiraceae bacterium]|nr:hypothetical protein [Lachnospiraceae bacterium]